jgi:chromosome segregation ATPase
MDALGRRAELAATLRLGALRSTLQRRAAEREILGRLAARLSPPAPAGELAAPAGRAEELLERLAVLRVDYADLLGATDRLAAEVAERDELLATRAAEYDRLWEELQGYVGVQNGLNARIHELETTLHEERREAARLQHSHHAMVSSKTWRLTEPLRRAARRLNRPAR